MDSFDFLVASDFRIFKLKDLLIKFLITGLFQVSAKGKCFKNIYKPFKPGVEFCQNMFFFKKHAGYVLPLGNQIY